MLSLILALIIAVAAFNIVSTLVMAVTDKQSDIAILRTLGASPRSIMKVFIVQGTLIGIVGTALGVIGGVLLAYNIGGGNSRDRTTVQRAVPVARGLLHQ